MFPFAYGFQSEIINNIKVFEYENVTFTNKLNFIEVSTSGIQLYATQPLQFKFVYP